MGCESVNSKYIIKDNTMKQINSPNILVFFCDQIRLDLLSCYGGNIVRTPHLDQLVRDSTVFERAYTPTAICSPARASLMTGLYPHNHHMFNNSTPFYSYCEHLKPGLDMLPDWIEKNTEYESAYFGKWHIGPADDLFNSTFHHTHPQPYEGGLSYLRNSHWHPNFSLGTAVDTVCGIAGTVDMPFEDFPDVMAANYTIDFLEKRDSCKPFISFCAFPGPHSPWVIPESFGLRYDPEKIPLWANLEDSMENKPINQKKLQLLGPFSEKNNGIDLQDHDQLKQLLAHMFTYIELIDDMVGRVINKLKKMGLYDDTVIVFTADHGDMAGAHGFLSKGSYMYDEIYRIPLVIKPTGNKRIGRTAEIVNLMDITATLMHLMNGKEVSKMESHQLDGKSLLPIIYNNENGKPLRQVHYAEYHGDWYGHYSARMVTDGKYKLVWNLTDLCEFYDLNNDPEELKNEFFNPTFKDLRNHYFHLLQKEGEEQNDVHIRLYHPEIEDALNPII